MKHYVDNQSSTYLPSPRQSRLMSLPRHHTGQWPVMVYLMGPQFEGSPSPSSPLKIRVNH